MKIKLSRPCASLALGEACLLASIQASHCCSSEDRLDKVGPTEEALCLCQHSPSWGHRWPAAHSIEQELRGQEFGKLDAQRLWVVGDFDLV